MRYRILGRIILSCGIFGVALSTIACQFVIGFSINNLSDREVNVSYSLRNMHYGFEPELVVEDKSKNIMYANFPEDRLNIDKVKRKVELKLLPGEKVRILRMRDRSLSAYEEEFNLTELALSSSDGKAVFEGRQVFAQFRPIESGRLTFGPKIIGFSLEYH